MDRDTKAMKIFREIFPKGSRVTVLQFMEDCTDSFSVMTSKNSNSSRAGFTDKTPLICSDQDGHPPQIDLVGGLEKNDLHIRVLAAVLNPDGQTPLSGKPPDGPPIRAIV